MKAKEPLWTKSYIMLMLGNLFVFMSFQMLIPTLPPYIKSIGASGLEIGLVTALFSIGAVLSRPFIGYMLEYKERKSLVIIGVISLLIVTLLYPVSQLVVLFLVFRFLHGLAWGWSTTVNGTVASDIVPSSRLGEGLGYFGLSITLGMIIAPSLGIYLFQVTSFSNLIYISAILGLISICLLFLIRYQTPDTVKATKKEDLKFSYLGSLVEKSSWYPAFITIIATFGYGSVVTFIVIFGEERGIDQIFLFYLFNAIMATISRPIAGKWFDKNGPMGIVLSCLTLTFIGLWVLSMAYSNLFIIISGILFGIGFGSLIPTLQSWTLSKTPPNRRGVANGMLFSAIDLGIGLGGLVFGILATFFDIATLFQISSIFLVIAIIATLFEGRKNKITQQHSVSS
ncbi:MFS transporter [Cytobacillus sp. IB215665]|uniref:MFS transporter n=1 Tax=Cytobacillus sp. IB215665 TaxID=3097357 RepID=UPI002A182B7F|nr:MFS transporter [Cytobacillus sp. IB215665]MDX8365271.1 MFS transporter [Cytobacillus sp. IB215665]